MHIDPNSFDDNFSPLSSKISISYPGKETVGEPFLIGSNSIPVGFAAIGQPVSVCHQWSTIGIFNLFSNHRTVSGSALSPAKNKVSNDLSFSLSIYLPSLSSFFTALKAVGAVKNDFTLYSLIILQKVPASGVPTGFPSNKTVEQPWNNGAYII